jgi:hypothetical protein
LEPCTFVVLKMQWLIHLYLSLRSTELKEGVIQEKHISKAWSDYPAELHSTLISALERFELLYKLPVSRFQLHHTPVGASCLVFFGTVFSLSSWFFLHLKCALTEAPSHHSLTALTHIHEHTHVRTCHSCAPFFSRLSLSLCPLLSSHTCTLTHSLTHSLSLYLCMCVCVCVCVCDLFVNS